MTDHAGSRAADAGTPARGSGRKPYVGTGHIASSERVATVGPRIQGAVIPDCRHFFGGGYTTLAMVADSQPSTHPRNT